MSKIALEEIKAFAKKQGYYGVEKLKKWKGYDIYRPFDTEDDSCSCAGLPLVVMVKGEEIRMSSPDEAMERLRSYRK